MRLPVTQLLESGLLEAYLPFLLQDRFKLLLALESHVRDGTLSRVHPRKL